MNSPVLILGAVWLLVLGYGLFYVGYNNFLGHGVSFSQAFFGRASGVAAPTPPSSRGSTNPVLSGARA